MKKKETTKMQTTTEYSDPQPVTMTEAQLARFKAGKKVYSSGKKTTRGDVNRSPYGHKI